MFHFICIGTVANCNLRVRLTAGAEISSGFRGRNKEIELTSKIEAEATTASGY
jgi:hypothetical protein